MEGEVMDKVKMQGSNWIKTEDIQEFLDMGLLQRRNEMKPRDCKIEHCLVMPCKGEERNHEIPEESEATGDCPESCEIVKLNKRVDTSKKLHEKHQLDIVDLRDKVDEITTLKKEIAELKEGEDCPDCANTGQYQQVIGPDSCGWCHGNPNSKFNRARWKK
jgi:hypothetical protein